MISWGGCPDFLLYSIITQRLESRRPVRIRMKTILRALIKVIEDFIGDCLFFAGQIKRIGPGSSTKILVF